MLLPGCGNTSEGGLFHRRQRIRRTVCCPCPAVVNPVPNTSSGIPSGEPGQYDLASRPSLLPAKVLSDNEPPAGFTALFNGKDLAGWQGASTEDPRKNQALSPEDREAKRTKSLEDIQQHWSVQGADLVNDGKGLYLTTDKDYGSYELWIDYKTVPKADSGIYLKGAPQVQIWDPMDETQFKNGCQKGSGGLWNNRAGKPGKDPLVLADKPLGEWNRFHIMQIGARTTVTLNDKLVVDNAILENYFDKERVTPLIPKGPIQLQTHGGEIRWKNIFLREIPADEAAKLLARDDSTFTSLFNGKDLTGWAGSADNYEVADGAIRCKPGKGGVLHTKDEYSDFVVRLEFKLPPGGNNGLAIRYPGQGDTAYVGMCELQVLDSEHSNYKGLDPRQVHGSAYGMAPAARGYGRPVGEWNYQEVRVAGSTITVELNGSMILDTDLSKITEYMANSAHPGKERTTGYFGFAGHSSPVEFRNIRIKSLAPPK
ncbi:MAG: DUF1080 domain-containing protein [Candidatus Saccharimonas sp.]|nr:DUF1080 domain-containing protein [Planctomycetaceae bacterium]